MHPSRHFTLRSVSLGLVGVTFISAFTPWNDYALGNTAFIGNNLPLGVVVLTWLFVVFVNGPLSRWRPHLAFTTGELAITLSMLLVGCALPSAGLMRYLPGSLLAPWWLSGTNQPFRDIFLKLGLPTWLYPHFESASPEQWWHDPVVVGFYGRWAGEGPPPYLAWLRPMITWGIFVLALYGALMCLLAIVRRQWMENERLRFPLADIQLALIEQPPPGQWLNATLRQKSFWLAFGVVLFIRLWNGAALYLPKYFPPIPTGFDLSGLTAEPPWKFVHWAFAKNELYFIVIGVTYFVSTPVAFSLWIFFVLDQIHRMAWGAATGDSPPNIAGWDRQWGALIAYALVGVWVGRRHWHTVLAQAIRGPRGGEPEGRYLPYSLAVWGLIACIAVMVGWMVLAGCDMIAAIVTVLIILMLFMVMARIVGETGLVYGELNAQYHRPWEVIASYAGANPISLRSFFLTTTLSHDLYTMREIVSVYAAHGMKLADQTVCQGRPEEMQRSFGRRFVALLMTCLLLAYVVSFASTLWTEYHYEASQDRAQETPINRWGTFRAAEGYMVDTTINYQNLRYPANYSPLTHMGLGFVLVSALSYLRLRLTWWPLHPVGFILLTTYASYMLWFSCCLGWLSKVLALRLGGASLYTRGKPLFLGLIVGDSVAAGCWLVINLVLHALSIPYQTVNVMPL